MYSKGGRWNLSERDVQQGWERDSICKCTSMERDVQQGWERDSICRCTARVGKGILSVSVHQWRGMYSKGGRGILSVNVQQGWEKGFSLYVSRKGARGILSVLGEGFTL